MHDEPLPACKLLHKQAQDHINESKPVRDQITTLATQMKELFGMRGAVYGIVVAILMQIGGFFYLWGGMDQMVKINTRRLNIIEERIYIRTVPKVQAPDEEK